jgi:hypothetical protein
VDAGGDRGHITFHRTSKRELRESAASTSTRALEIAAQTSAAPAHDGAPIQQSIEVREVIGPIEH